jgi:hypothetical protein
VTVTVGVGVGVRVNGVGVGVGVGVGMQTYQKSKVSGVENLRYVRELPSRVNQSIPPSARLSPMTRATSPATKSPEACLNFTYLPTLSSSQPLVSHPGGQVGGVGVGVGVGGVAVGVTVGVGVGIGVGVGVGVRVGVKVVYWVVWGVGTHIYQKSKVSGLVNLRYVRELPSRVNQSIPPSARESPTTSATSPATKSPESNLNLTYLPVLSESQPLVSQPGGQVIVGVVTGGRGVTVVTGVWIVVAGGVV